MSRCCEEYREGGEGESAKKEEGRKVRGRGGTRKVRGRGGTRKRKGRGEKRVQVEGKRKCW